MIEVEQLKKNYGAVAAVRGISFHVGRGEVVGFVGPNGAGKSTTLRIITGFIGATSGSVRILGHDIQKDPMRARQSLGYMPETAPLYPEMRVREYLHFRAHLKRVSSKSRERAIERALERAGVSHAEDALIGQLSKGYRQRVALADALVADPPLLILDEPTAGLDPNQVRQVRVLLKELSQDHTILLSTHILSEVEATCDRALVIHRGKLVLQGPLGELFDQQLSVVLVLNDPEQRAAALLTPFEKVHGTEIVATDGPLTTVRLVLGPAAEGELMEAVVRTLVEGNVGVRSVSREQRRFEDVFSQITQGTTPPKGEAQ